MHIVTFYTHTACAGQKSKGRTPQTGFRPLEKSSKSARVVVTSSILLVVKLVLYNSSCDYPNGQRRSSLSSCTPVVYPKRNKRIFSHVSGRTIFYLYLSSYTNVRLYIKNGLIKHRKIHPLSVGTQNKLSAIV